MAEKATQTTTQSLEQEAWDLFEVGASEDVIVLAKRNPENYFLQHLSYLALYELTGKVSVPAPKGISIFAPIVDALANLEMGRTKEAKKSLDLYIQVSSNPLSFSLVQLALKILFREESYTDALSIIDRFHRTSKSRSFIKEEITAIYFQKRYDEVIRVFRENMKVLNDPEIHKLVGLALLFLDRHKEANLIFANIPNKLNLPSFEEKKLSYANIYKEIQNKAMREDSLTHKELEDMGFAYLFHGEYDKAEKMFVKLSSLLKSKLCNV